MASREQVILGRMIDRTGPGHFSEELGRWLPPRHSRKSVSSTTRAATSSPAYKSASHKILIDNVPFSKLSSSEQRAFNDWRRSLGKPPLT